MKHLLKCLVASVALAAPVSATVFTFDGPGGLANDHAAPGFSFQPAVLDFAYDGFGAAIPGTLTWRVDGSAPAVTVDNPLDFGRGPAPSPDQALNALFQPVMILLPSTSLLEQFGLKLDNDTFGVSDAQIEFYSKNNVLLGTLPVDQTIAGLSVDLGGALAGVEHIVLPAGAFYDDLRIAAVPEPSEYAGVGGVALLAAAGVRAWRRRAALAKA